MVRLTLENENGKYVVEVPADRAVVLNDLLELVVVPVLLAAGYRSEMLDKIMLG